MTERSRVSDDGSTRFFGHTGFVWNQGLWRLLLVLVMLTALIASSGTVAFIQSVFGVIDDIRRSHSSCRSRPST